MSYVRALGAVGPHGVPWGYTSPGWSDALSAQKSQAGGLYGYWPSGDPVITYAMAKALADEWTGKANALSYNDPWFSGVGDRWYNDRTRAYDELVAELKSPMVARTAPNGGTFQAMGQAATTQFWLTLWNLSSSMSSLNNIPTTWDIAWESIVEATQEAAKAVQEGAENLSKSVLWLMKYGPYVALGLLGFVAVSYLPRRKA